MRDLTEVQSFVLTFIGEHQREHQMPPTRAEIARHFGWKSANAAEECLRAIASKGYIYLRPGVSRGIFVVNPEQATAAGA